MRRLYSGVRVAGIPRCPSIAESYSAMAVSSVRVLWLGWWFPIVSPNTTNTTKREEKKKLITYYVVRCKKSLINCFRGGNFQW